MTAPTKLARYARIADQLAALIENVADPTARRATAVALLHHKLPGVSWTGFYLVKEEHLVVDVYRTTNSAVAASPSSSTRSSR